MCNQFVTDSRKIVITSSLVVHKPAEIKVNEKTSFSEKGSLNYFFISIMAFAFVNYHLLLAEVWP